LALGPLLVAAAALAISAPTAYGWGAGHGTQARMVMDALPGAIRDFFSENLRSKIVGEYCYFPDTVRSFDEKLLGREAVDELQRMQIGPGDLHQDSSAAVSFLFLNRAFAGNQPEHAAVWLGSLIHTIGDDGCHLVLVAYLSEIRRFRPNVRIGEGCSDLAQVAATSAGQATLQRLMAGYAPRVIADRPDQALRKLILLAYEEMDFGAQRQCRIGRTFNIDSPQDAREDGMRALAEIGAEGTRNILDATLTAWELARRGTPVRLTGGLVRQARANVQGYLDGKPLEHDTVYAGTLDSRPRRPFAGVVVEPSTFMGEARFGYCGAVLLGQVMRTFREAGVPYAALDIRKVLAQGLPSAARMPVLVIVSGGFNCPGEPLARYVAAGGRLLWIGGCDKGLLGALSQSLVPADPRLLPVSNRYEDANREVMARVSVRFLNEFGQSLGPAPLRFVNNPNTFGWTTPRCGLQVGSRAAEVEALAAVTDGTRSMDVAAALKEKGKARHVFVPQYLLLPYALARGPAMDFSQPVLDGVGKKIVLAAVEMLWPELVKPSPRPAAPGGGIICPRPFPPARRP
jgi:hypothetical protein